MKRWLITFLVLDVLGMAVWVGERGSFAPQNAVPATDRLACGSGPKPTHYGVNLPATATNAVNRAQSQAAAPVKPAAKAVTAKG
jgi:hypothetical protein